MSMNAYNNHGNHRKHNQTFVPHACTKTGITCKIEVAANKLYTNL